MRAIKEYEDAPRRKREKRTFEIQARCFVALGVYVTGD